MESCKHSVYKKALNRMPTKLSCCSQHKAVWTTSKIVTSKYLFSTTMIRRTMVKLSKFCRIWMEWPCWMYHRARRSCLLKAFTWSKSHHAKASNLCMSWTILYWCKHSTFARIRMISRCSTKGSIKSRVSPFNSCFPSKMWCLLLTRSRLSSISSLSKFRSFLSIILFKVTILLW